MFGLILQQPADQPSKYLSRDRPLNRSASTSASSAGIPPAAREGCGRLFHLFEQLLGPGRHPHDDLTALVHRVLVEIALRKATVAAPAIPAVQSPRAT